MNGLCEEPLLPIRHYEAQDRNREVGKVTPSAAIWQPRHQHEEGKRACQEERSYVESGVPGEGVEPSWAEARGILSPVRLPVSPPRRHVLLPHLGKSVERLAGEWRTGTPG